MVDALCRARLWLKSDGYLIDLRPAETIPEVVVGSDEYADVIGVLTVDAERLERHAAADHALADVLDRILFVLEAAREFTFLRYADSAEELRDYIGRNGNRAAWTTTPAFGRRRQWSRDHARGSGYANAWRLEGGSDRCMTV